MSLQSFSNDFIDWIRARVLEWGDGLVTEEILFDERRQALPELIRKGLSSQLGYCVVVSMASARRVQQGDSPDDTVHRVTCPVALFRGSMAKLTQQQSMALAETLYIAFCGAEYMPVPGSGRPDVYADDFDAQASEKGGALFSFTVSIDRDIDKLNNH